MKIAITGTQSTGKTTLLNALKEHDLFKDFKFIDEVTRSVKSEGFKINEQGDDATQIAIIKKHLDNLKLAGANAIYDRCFLDSLVYTYYLYQKGKVRIETLDSAYIAFENYIDQYDLIILLEPEFDVVADNVRSVSVEFRDEIAKIFKYFIIKYNLCILRLSGSTVERVRQFEEIYDLKIKSLSY